MHLRPTGIGLALSLSAPSKIAVKPKAEVVVNLRKLRGWTCAAEGGLMEVYTCYLTPAGDSYAV